MEAAGKLAGGDGEMSKASEWRVTSNIIDETKLYRVYRIREISEVDHSGNREYQGGYTQDRQEAVARAAALNRGEVLHGEN